MAFWQRKLKSNNSTLDTENRWHDFCQYYGIRNPRAVDYSPFYQGEDNNLAISDYQADLKNYLRLAHTFRLWDFHFWMNWMEFQRYCKYSKEFADISVYLPCDCVDRQCDLECPYFFGECPRNKGEELKSPIDGVDGRWEFHDKKEY